jgi:hypothetical protein
MPESMCAINIFFRSSAHQHQVVPFLREEAENPQTRQAVQFFMVNQRLPVP